MSDPTSARAKGFIHERINQVLFLVIVLPLTALLTYLRQFFMAIAFPLGAAYGVWLVTPDLKLEIFTHSESRWLRPIGYLLYLYYYPLALVLRHRAVSHTPVLGASIIYAYTWWLPTVVLLVAGWRPFWILHPDLHVGLLTGLVCAHLLHIVEGRLFGI